MIYLKYFWTVCQHKYYVLVECFKRGLFIQGIMHDMSKFYLCEFIPYAKRFKGKENNNLYFSQAWQHHYENNKHHPEYWSNQEIPKKYLLEILCDYIAAGKVYSKNNFTKSEPLAYFLKNKDNICMNQKSKKYLEELLIQYSKGENKCISIDIHI